MAELAASRGTCDRIQVGCVIVVGRNPVSTGYNGSLPGAPHCDEVGHKMELFEGKERCQRTVHSEANAVANAAKRGISIDGGTAYITRLPCPTCLKLLASAGIRRIVCGVLKPEYIKETEWWAKEAGISLEIIGESCVEEACEDIRDFPGMPFTPPDIE
jgi:dCMP deaminase